MFLVYMQVVVTTLSSNFEQQLFKNPNFLFSFDNHKETNFSVATFDLHDCKICGKFLSTVQKQGQIKRLEKVTTTSRYLASKSLVTFLSK